MSGVKFLGHSLHPILIVFPLGLLGGATFFELFFLISGRTEFALVSFWLIIAGLIGGLVAAPFGLLDWVAIASGTRAKTIGLIHGLTNVLALLLFAVSGYLRWNSETRPGVVATSLVFIGFIVALFGGWLGGELVERLGIGVHEGANANAPSSLEKDPPIYSNVEPKKI